ncbi:2-amino-4-hydroxy-6-hydroxymethyldihydropteridine diphosphokinase [Blattabacterium cuenoti]|uniref:2-amino-4-hydroxy-6- hydroxymethyldihydropteridine diphosphokinase n=1 Tax=Blattabacterium cuenoti TaxID=1653831 RepID=UPI0021D23C71|nr:2-amino-4-hydroxy-6-hydroxymethyldihydropteridine diphosphokinase [Blattabacterium cuenoti]
MSKKHNIFLLIGGNQENRKKYLNIAIILINKKIGKIINKSSFFKSEAWKMKKDSPYFLNIIVHVKTFYSPIFLMNEIKKIENLIIEKKKKNVKI